MSNVILDSSTGFSIDADIDEATTLYMDGADEADVIERLMIAKSRCIVLAAWLDDKIEELRAQQRMNDAGEWYGLPAIDWLD